MCLTDLIKDDSQFKSHQRSALQFFGKHGLLHARWEIMKVIKLIIWIIYGIKFPLLPWNLEGSSSFDKFFTSPLS